MIRCQVIGCFKFNLSILGCFQEEVKCFMPLSKITDVLFVPAVKPLPSGLLPHGHRAAQQGGACRLALSLFEA
jgi:hypothetical protein